MSATCRDCDEGLAHCHDAVVVHGDDGGWECLAVTCDLGRDAHVVVVACGELDAPCACGHA